MSAIALLLFALSATVSAQDNKLYVKEFAIKKGEVKTISIYLDNPTYRLTAMQFDLYLSGGIKLVEDEDGPFIDPTARIPSTACVINGDWMHNRTFYRKIFYNNNGLYVSGTSGALFKVDVTTDETFGTTDQPAKIEIKNARFSDIDNTSTSYRAVETMAYAYEAKSYIDLFAEASEGKKAYLDEPIKIVAKGMNQAFAVDQSGHWIKLILPDENTVQPSDVYQRASVGGYITDTQLNPTIVVDNADNLMPSNDIVSSYKEIVDLTNEQNLSTTLSTLSTLNANQVVYVRGHYFINDNGEGCISAYSGKNGVRGTTLSVNTDLLSTSLTPGQPYDFSVAAIQLKAPWDTPSGSPKRIASGDQKFYENFIVYPLTESIVTGIDGITADKGITSVKYYNVAGHESDAPFSGVNIVVTTLNDGTTTTTKIIK